MTNQLLNKKIRLVWIILMTAGLILFFATGCGSKKTITQLEKKEKTDIELTDNSTFNTKIEQERQYLDTKIRERIVTLYGVRFDTIKVEGKLVITPTPYPLKKEENRVIYNQKLKNYLSRKDSIQNEIGLKDKSDLQEKEENISEMNESRIFYLIVMIVLAVSLFLSLLQKR